MQKGIRDFCADEQRPGPERHDQRVTWLARQVENHISAYVQALFGRLAASNAGAVAAEYAFLIVFISIGAAIGMVVLGDDLQTYFQNLGAALENASTPTADPFAT